MADAHITFKRLIQDSQDYGSNDEHMVSRAFFDMTIDKKEHKNLSVDIKQQVGSDFETSPLEISGPVGYVGPFNYQTFRDEVEKYYRSIVGSSGSIIHTTSSAPKAHMRNNTTQKEMKVEFNISKDGPAW